MKATPNPTAHARAARRLAASLACAALAFGCGGGEAKPEPTRAASTAGATADGPTTKPPPPPPVARAATAEELADFAARPAIMWTALPVAADAVQQIGPSGGAVALPDGTRVDFPPGALVGERKITLRARTRETGGPSATVVEVDAGDAPLQQDAVLSLPCPRLAAGLAQYFDSYSALHDHGGRVTDLPATWDQANDRVLVRCREFSHVGVQPDTSDQALNARVEQWARAAFEGGGEVAPITVPYYHQFTSSWCWAAAAQMLLKAYGRDDVEIWDLAVWNRSSYMGALAAGLSDAWQMTGSATGMFTDRGIHVEHFNIPWGNVVEQYDYIVRQLRLGRPVMLTIGNFHVVVLVGCDATNVFVNDPSGVLSEVIHLIKTGNDSPAEGTKLVAMPIPWTDLAQAFRPTMELKRKNKGGMRLGMSWTTVVTDPLPARPAVTLQVNPNSLLLEHPNHRPHWAPHPNAYFVWDGKVENGYRFCVDCGDDAFAGCAHQTPDAAHAHVTPLHASMSSKLYLTARISNAGEKDAQVEVSASIAGKPLGKRDHKLTARTTNVDAACVHGFTLRSLGLDCGVHELEVRAHANGTFADSLRIKLPIGPSKVEGLRLENLPDGGGVLSWKPVPEKDVEYDVFVVNHLVDELARKVQTVAKAEHRLAATSATRFREEWFVLARHRPSGLLGPPSDYLADIGGQENRPFMLRSEGRDGHTIVDFRSQAIADLADGGYIKFHLLTAPGPGGPWNQQSTMDVARRDGKLVGGQLGRVVGDDAAQIDDTYADHAQVRTPPWYKVVMVTSGAANAPPEAESSPLEPGTER